MNRFQEYRLNALERVQAFLDSHPEPCGVLKDSAARHELDAAIAGAREASHLQATSPLVMRAQMSRQTSLVRSLEAQHMRPIRVFARGKLRGVPDFSALTKNASGLSVKQTVLAARAMATAAAPHVNALTEAGFPADAVAQLEAAANALESAYAERANAKVAMIGATKAVAEQLKCGTEAVQILDGVVSRLLVGNASLQAEWRAAKRVTAKPGVPRGSNTVSTPLTAPVSTQQATEAATTQAA